jgi:hypothetical protein
MRAFTAILGATIFALSFAGALALKENRGRENSPYPYEILSIFAARWGGIRAAEWTYQLRLCENV